MSAPEIDGFERVELPIVRLDPLLSLPSYAHDDDAGLDLRARIDLVLDPGQRALVPTGVAVAIPRGYAGFVHPRSGLAARHGLTIVNAPGTIDAGYRGEICVNLLNTDSVAPITISRGDRIAQLILQRVSRAELREVGSLDGTVRGAGGHGSTGVTSTDDHPRDHEGH